jgi:uncharacterized protein (DUF2062 family)/SAM-dependent methyltransferase
MMVHEKKDKTSTRVRALAERLWREHASAHRLGLAVGVGILIGCTPFFGLHLWLGLGIAIGLRLNKVAVFLGSQISLPPLAPFVGFASVQVGWILVHGQRLELGIADFHLLNLGRMLHQFLLSWLLGGLVLGLTLAGPAYLITWALVRRRRRLYSWRRSAEPSPPEDKAPRADGRRRVKKASSLCGSEDLKKATALYLDAPRGHQLYVRFKYWMDPLYRQVCNLVGPRVRIIDLGTGLGMLPALLAVRGQVVEAIGVDWDEVKIKSGRRACAAWPNVTFIHADIRRYRIPSELDAVVLADVLHYWSAAEQRSLLKHAASALRPGGCLFIRETIPSRGSGLTRLLEKMAVYLRWNRGGPLCFLSEAELRAALEGVGLFCYHMRPASSFLHRGNKLFCGVVPPEGEKGYNGEWSSLGASSRHQPHPLAVKEL